jgi:hypothetical protein
LEKGQKPTFGLVHREICPKPASDTERTPDEEDFGTHVSLVFIDHIRSDNCNDTVPKPIGSHR